MPSYLWLMTHPSCIGWVQAGDVWALCLLHFYVCPKPACCSCVRRGLEACLYILPSILDFLWYELFTDLSLWFAPIIGLGFVRLWSFLSLTHSFVLFCSLAFPAALFYYSCCDVIWPKLAEPLWVCCLFFSRWLSMIIRLYTTWLVDSCVLFISS